MVTKLWTCKMYVPTEAAPRSIKLRDKPPKYLVSDESNQIYHLVYTDTKTRRAAYRTDGNNVIYVSELAL